MARAQGLERTGLVIVRIWIEGLLPAGLRAKITHHRDIAVDDGESVYASSVDETVDIVRERLEHFVRDAEAEQQGNLAER